MSTRTILSHGPNSRGGATLTVGASVPPPRSAGADRAIGEKYRIRCTLGTGGVGTVYEAENTWTGRVVAVKVLRREFADAPEIVRRFMQEAQHAVRVAHPHIVDVLDMARDPHDGSLFIVQERLEGVDLRRWLQSRGALPLGEALALLAPVMDALAAAHALGVVHRDIKPENIFLARGPTGDLVPKIIDFGIAKLVDGGEHAPRISYEGAPIGTPHYMSPEQLRGESGVDARADVWSLGVVLYELLTGRCPFDAPDCTALLRRIEAGPPTRLDAVAPGVPSAVVDVVHRALAPSREERYPTVRDFDAALRAAATTAVSRMSAESAPILSYGSASALSVAPEPTSRLTPTPPRRDATALWSALASAVVVLGALGYVWQAGWFTLHGSRPAQASAAVAVSTHGAPSTRIPAPAAVPMHAPASTRASVPMHSPTHASAMGPARAPATAHGPRPVSRPMATTPRSNPVAPTVAATHHHHHHRHVHTAQHAARDGVHRRAAGGGPSATLRHRRRIPVD